MLLSDWANIASIVSSLAVLAILGQVFIGYRQIKADHERSRRERSVELLLEWSKQVCSNKKGSLARKLIESLSEENCRGIFNQEQVGLSHKYKDVISQIFDQDDCVNNDHKEDECADIMLNVSQSAELRWYAITYLNMLESILVSWQYSIVDREIVEHQFSYLFKTENGFSPLRHFRRAAGGEMTYPAIEVFSNHIEQERRKALAKKAKVA